MIPKFRAWDKYRNKMNYKVMVGNCDTDDENWTCPIIWIEEEKDWLHFDDYNSIMQSTGLFDKNGKEIFEGDIVRVLDSTYTVFYDNERGSYRLKPHDDRWNVDYMSNFSHGGNFEVVGNIYENPELLEVEE